MNYTESYNLPQWEDTDVVTREDVNGAMAVIDAAIAGGGGCRMAYGTYHGTNEYGQNNANSLTFDFEPKLVIVQNSEGINYDLSTDSTLGVMVMLRGLYAQYYSGVSGRNYIRWNGNTVSWWSDTDSYLQLNRSAVTYSYFAIG